MNKLLERLLSAIFLTGQVTVHLLQAKIYRLNTFEQMAFVGPGSLLIALITATFVGMVFTIQVAREFIYFGATTAVGGILSIALTRELAPVSHRLFSKSQIISLLFDVTNFDSFVFTNGDYRRLSNC